MTKNQPQRTPRQTAEDQTELQQPTAAREHDGGEGVITARGGTAEGTEARKNAEQAVDVGGRPDSPEQTDPNQG